MRRRTSLPDPCPGRPATAVHADAGRVPAVTVGPRFACAICGERFVVTPAAYAHCSGVVECPACGSLDLVLLAIKENVNA